MKTVLIGVTGCVAIYKTCEIVRGLQKAGVRVKVVMTRHSTEFIQPALFRALTREPVAVGLFDDAPGDPIHHISLAKEADLFLIAPCTANVIGKIANGIADDLLTTTAMATTAPLVIAPARTRRCVHRLRERLSGLRRCWQRSVGRARGHRIEGVGAACCKARSGREAPAHHGGANRRAYRPRPLHLESLIGKNGVCPGGSRAGTRCHRYDSDRSCLDPRSSGHKNGAGEDSASNVRGG